jgi:hypothetical protein
MATANTVISFINTGTGANKGDGDTLRTAFNKINENFRGLSDDFQAAGVASFNGAGGIITFTATDISTVLGYVPYPDSNPNNYLSSAVLDSYPSKSYVNGTFVTTSTIQDYPTTNAINLILSDYATKVFIGQQDFVTATSLISTLLNYATQDNLATKASNQYVDDTIANAQFLVPSDLTDYATQVYVGDQLANYTTTQDLTTDYAKLTDLASLVVSAGDSLYSTGTLNQLKITDDGVIQITSGTVGLFNAVTQTPIVNSNTASTYVELSIRTKFGKPKGLRFNDNGAVAPPIYQAGYGYADDATGYILVDGHYVNERSGIYRDITGQPNLKVSNFYKQFPESQAHFDGGGGHGTSTPQIWATNYTYPQEPLPGAPPGLDELTIEPQSGQTRWGTALVLAVDTWQDGANDFNYIEITQNGIDIAAARGIISIIPRVAVDAGVEGWYLEDYAYKFEPTQMTFPDGSTLGTGRVSAPAHSYGQVGDKLGQIAFDSTYIYYCTGDYVNNSTDIWKRIDWSASTW